MEEDIQIYLPNIMFRMTPCISRLFEKRGAISQTIWEQSLQIQEYKTITFFKKRILLKGI